MSKFIGQKRLLNPSKQKIYVKPAIRQYSGDLYATKIEELIQQHKNTDDPIFIYAALQNVHYPLQGEI